MKVIAKLRWITQGGAETLESYNANPRKPKSWKIPQEHMQYITSLPLFWENDEFIVTHALVSEEAINGLRKAKVDKKSSIKREWILSAFWSRKKPDTPADERKNHISGHSITKRIRKNQKLNSVQIDTGCCEEGRLTAWCPEKKQSLSVKCIVSKNND